MAGSIWGSGFLGSALNCDMDAILDKENFELSEVLGETRLLEELERPNERLIEYLSKRETINEMLGILMEFDENDTFKEAHAVAEVFSSGVEGINQVLVAQDHEYILDLFNRLAKSPGGLGARKAGYIHNLFTTLVKDDGELTLEFLNRHKDLVMNAMLGHLDERAMAAGFKALLYAGFYETDNSANPVDESSSGWATGKGTVVAIVQKVFEGGEENADIHDNASKILRSLVGEGVELSEEFMPHTRLRPHLVGEDVCIMLANGIFHASPPSSDSSKEAAFKILTALVGSSTFRDSDSDASGIDMSEVPSIKYPCAAINHKQMCHDLRAEHGLVPAGFGSKIRRIGPYRIAIVKYLALVFSSESLAVTRELATNGVVDACLELLFDYPWSSMLHVEVLCIVQFIIRSYDLLMQLRVFGKFNLLTKILDHLEANNKASNGATKLTAANASGDGSDSSAGEMVTSLATSTNRGCLYRICMDVDDYLVMSEGGDENDGAVDPMEAAMSPIRIWAEKHKVRWQNFVIGTLRQVSEKQERHLAGLPIPCPDGINVIYDPANSNSSTGNGNRLSDSMRGLALHESDSGSGDMHIGDLETEDGDDRHMNWE